MTLIEVDFDGVKEPTRLQKFLDFLNIGCGAGGWFSDEIMLQEAHNLGVDEWNAKKIIEQLTDFVQAKKMIQIEWDIAKEGP